jgi:hypothetical protein
MVQIQEQICFSFKPGKSSVLAIFLDGDKLSCQQIGGFVNGTEPTATQNGVNLVAPYQNRSLAEKLPLLCPAFGANCF